MEEKKRGRRINTEIKRCHCSSCAEKNDKVYSLWMEKEKVSSIRTRYYPKLEQYFINYYNNKIPRPLHDDSVFSTLRLFILVLSLLSSELASFPESTEACLRILRGFPSFEDSFSSFTFSDDKEEAATAIFSLASGFWVKENKKIII